MALLPTRDEINAFIKLLNPFIQIPEELESSEPPQFKEEFLKKLKNAFQVFSGDNNLDNEGNPTDKTNVGLAGWAMLLIPFLIEVSAKYSNKFYLDGIKGLIDNKDNKDPLPWRVAGVIALSLGVLVTGIIFAPLFLARNALAGLLTFLSLPIVAIVAGVSVSDKENKLALAKNTTEVVPKEVTEQLHELIIGNTLDLKNPESDAIKNLDDKKENIEPDMNVTERKVNLDVKPEPDNLPDDKPTQETPNINKSQ